MKRFLGMAAAACFAASGLWFAGDIIYGLARDPGLGNSAVQYIVKGVVFLWAGGFFAGIWFWEFRRCRLVARAEQRRQL